VPDLLVDMERDYTVRTTMVLCRLVKCCRSLKTPFCEKLLHSSRVSPEQHRNGPGNHYSKEVSDKLPKRRRKVTRIVICNVSVEKVI